MYKTVLLFLSSSGVKAVRVDIGIHIPIEGNSIQIDPDSFSGKSI